MYVQLLKTLSLFYTINLIFQYTNPLPFETEPHSIHTIPLLREHVDSFLYYIRFRTYEITPSQAQFQVILTLLKMLTQEHNIGH